MQNRRRNLKEFHFNNKNNDLRHFLLDDPCGLVYLFDTETSDSRAPGCDARGTPDIDGRNRAYTRRASQGGQLPKKVVSLEKHNQKLQKALLKKRQSEVRYCGRGLPSQPLPAGFFLVHNHVRPQSSLGSKGFRAWIQKGSDRLVECHCDFGGLRNANVQKHYRVRGLQQVEFDPFYAALAESQA